MLNGSLHLQLQAGAFSIGIMGKQNSHQAAMVETVLPCWKRESLLQPIPYRYTGKMARCYKNCRYLCRAWEVGLCASSASMHPGGCILVNYSCPALHLKLHTILQVKQTLNNAEADAFLKGVKKQRCLGFQCDTLAFISCWGLSGTCQSVSLNQPYVLWVDTDWIHWPPLRPCVSAQSAINFSRRAK